MGEKKGAGSFFFHSSENRYPHLNKTQEAADRQRVRHSHHADVAGCTCIHIRSYSCRRWNIQSDVAAAQSSVSLFPCRGGLYTYTRERKFVELIKISKSPPFSRAYIYEALSAFVILISTRASAVNFSGKKASSPKICENPIYHLYTLSLCSVSPAAHLSCCSSGK